MKQYAILILLFALHSLPPTNASSAEPQLTDLFVSGAGGYHTYRIPAIVATKSGALLAICEGRKTSRADHGDVDLLMRRSSDGGRSWQPTKLIYEEGADKKITIGNPCPVVDRDSGVVWLPFTRDNDDVEVESAAANSGEFGYM